MPAKWTVATPWIDKPYAVDPWLQSFDRMNWDRSQIKVVWHDMSGNPEIHSKLLAYKLAHQSEFAGFVLTERQAPTYADYETIYLAEGDANARHQAIANSMNALNATREGHLLVWEDDIIAPSDAFERVSGLLAVAKNVGAVTGVQYSRNASNLNNLLLWDASFPVVKDGRVLSHAPARIEDATFSKLNTELEEGLAYVEASATGFVAYRDSFASGYQWRAADKKGQDMCVGFDMKRRPKTKPLQLALLWDLKLAHITQNEFGSVVVLRGKKGLCTTEVFDANGTLIP